MKRALVLILATTALACGGGANTVDGSFQGQSIDVGGGTLANLSDGTSESSMVLLVSQDGDACTYLSTRPLNNTRFVAIILGVMSPSGSVAGPSASGTYVVKGEKFPDTGDKLASIQFDVVGACGIGTNANATDGSVHVTRVVADSAGHVQSLAGTFEATFATGEHMTGSFDVKNCPAARLQFYTCG